MLDTAHIAREFVIPADRHHRFLLLQTELPHVPNISSVPKAKTAIFLGTPKVNYDLPAFAQLKNGFIAHADL